MIDTVIELTMSLDRINLHRAAATPIRSSRPIIVIELVMY